MPAMQGLSGSMMSYIPLGSKKPNVGAVYRV